MSYFRELPNFEYISNFKNKQFNTDYIVAKNIFKRAKIREDLKNSFVVMDYYTIQNSERPDQVAEKVYGNSELDWVILTTNNIINIRDEWPLDGNSFYNYLLEKYGSDQEIAATHHYETLEVLDEYNRVVVPEGLIVDPPLNQNIITGIGISEYQLQNYINEKSNYEVTVNLNQFFNIQKRNEVVTILITDIKIENSFLNIIQRNNQQEKITIENNLSNWPASWGGTLEILTREDKVIVSIGDTIFDNDITINKNLYEITTNPELSSPVFKFITP